ncbi:nuclear transport factor 2 family protein [Streptomyces sp. TRM66268-LWL]|uniref:Nuclear transport factor 2 family protein n=1 Tax=Streptomyces polyasparticus TaxID=2767826 RepID=A0ABR7STA3_9ACTN|nr:nuclear transport factor 2 family protein [Streptomyces polyasparticus]MBC9717518.1 nuclear transport factor 2 family protein [Streptomyces polyasparticus]
MEPSGCVQQQRADEFPAAELLAAERRLRHAVRAGDLTGLRGLFHPQLVSVRPDGRCHAGEQEAEAFRTGALVVDAIDPEETVATVAGATGVTRTVLSARGHCDGVPFEARVLCTRTWVHEEPAGWQVLATRVGEVEPTV